MALADLAELEVILGVTLADPSLLETALVHTSYAHERPGAVAHNERLEFLGDAVLGFVIAQKLYRDFPGLSEGEMTRRRAVVVSRDALADVARAIRLGDFLYLGRGEETSGGRDKTANLAGALEAVIAAVFLDRGEAEAGRLVLRLLGGEMAKVLRGAAGFDAKSRLQELTQSRYQVTPVYRLLAESGPSHEKEFTVEVLAGDRSLGQGTGRSKKLAETEAARSALNDPANGFTD
jgi:ribonuclease-3